MRTMHFVYGGQYDQNGDPVIQYYSCGDDDNFVYVAGSFFDVYAEDGNDVVFISGVGNYANLGGGDDIGIAIGSEPAFIDGNQGNDIIVGGSGGDIIIGGTGADVLIGGAGQDFIVADVQDVYVRGGAGADVFSIEATQLLMTSDTLPVSAFADLIESGTIPILDFNADEGDILDMASFNLTQEDVYSSQEMGMTFFMGDDFAVGIIGVAFADVGSAIATGQLILDYNEV